MHKVLFPLSLVLLVLLGIWAALLFLRQPKPTPPVVETPIPQEAAQPNTGEIVPSELEAEASTAAETSTEAIPELNPAEKTNPFSGTYKNPFAK